MEKFVIHGGIPLQGSVRVSGSKNAALPMMAACLIASGPIQLRNVPDLADVRTMAGLLQTLGVVSKEQGGVWSLNAVDDQACRADYELVRQMRASICVLGPLLARRGRGVVSLPGGCQIGHRPIDLHLKGLHALGAEIQIENGYVIASARQLRGAYVHLGGGQGSTVTGTCNVMTAACLAKGTTVIDAAASEPEVVDLGEMLVAMGARIEGLGTSQLVIQGVDELHPVDYEIIPDRIEAATLLIAAAITRGSVTIEQCLPSHMGAILDKLRETGVEVACYGNSIQVSVTAPLKPCDTLAVPYPGFPTDVQAQWTALMTLTAGRSVITDKVFPNRFMHVSELLRMGADIRRDGDCAIITGVPHLSGADVMASDLRASAALVLAGLAARGQTTIHRMYHLDRGYEQLETKLRWLGADVVRVPE